MIPRAFWHYLAAFYFALQSLLIGLWWLALPLEPRAPFRGFALLAFWIAGALLLVGAGVWTSVQLVFHPAKARWPLVLHLIGSVCVALGYATRTLLTGEAKMAALALSVCAICGAFFGWKAVFQQVRESSRTWPK